MPSADALAVLEFLREPALLLEPAGKIIGANRGARRLLGSEIVSRDLFQFCAGSAPALSAYLRQCSGTTEPLPGSIMVRRPDGTEARLRAYGARLSGSPDDPSVRLALRLLPAETDGFSVLARRVRALNSEIHQRRRTQAELEEALRHNETLLRELQHRVKNNMQMLLGLFSAAQRETEFQEVRAFLDEVADRLMAVATAQQLMYQSHDFQVVEAAAFIKGLCEAISRTQDRNVRLEATAFEGHLSNDVVFPLALILNELLTNAYKYGSRGPGSRICVDLQRDSASYVLTVRDDGPGMPPRLTERRSSGLGLVRGLCRQIGGSLTIDNVDGAHCQVRIAGSGGDYREPTG